MPLILNPRSFGNYDDSTNILHTGDWNTLPANLQAIFNKAAADIGNGMSGQSFFELGTHQWVFIHELGHWWRACQHQKATWYQAIMIVDAFRERPVVTFKMAIEREGKVSDQ